MVTKPDTPNPPAPTGLKPNPTKIEPPLQVSGKAATSLPTDADVANKDHGSKFKMPDKVTTQEIRDGSFRYGGGRSAGNRSLADNLARKVIEP